MCCTHLTNICGTMVAKDILQGCQLPRFSMLRIDWEGMKDDIITHGSWCRLCKKYNVASNRYEFVMTEDARKRCSWQCNIWPDCFTSHQSHYCLYYNMALTQVYEKMFDVNSKIAQTKKIYLKFHCRKVDSARKWHFSDNPRDFRL